MFYVATYAFIYFILREIKTVNFPGINYKIFFMSIIFFVALANK